ncbi:hypothetical protein [Marivita geojedonensis]|uniref:Uncharacterized protein n=1 Tax=Marivita geojedonensis TaxID=1123756 RepID=A0A1X4NCX3_9RHOB|nr:hypothetical protein [Marivita geojedonensis]OSQ44677.1 hypothetical protein MGEO_18845 [Marivita geojedonensis]PRY76384.1 hypothetical protein CLV76_1114 [Marivita geojedonensis]
MIDIIRQTEATPTYPAAPDGLSAAAAALDPDMIWARIESYIAHRFSEREIIWTVSGFADDAWLAPIGPVVSQTAEKWIDGAWSAVSLDDGPLGPCLPSDGTFRITATVGATPVPSEVDQAYRRLAEYWAVETGKAGVSEHRVSIGGEIEESFSRSPVWMARAMVNSGAADLLRKYRSYP